MFDIYTIYKAKEKNELTTNQNKTQLCNYNYRKIRPRDNICRTVGIITKHFDRYLLRFLIKLKFEF